MKIKLFIILLLIPNFVLAQIHEHGADHPKVFHAFILEADAGEIRKGAHQSWPASSNFTASSIVVAVPIVIMPRFLHSFKIAKSGIPNTKLKIWFHCFTGLIHFHRRRRKAV